MKRVLLAILTAAVAGGCPDPNPTAAYTSTPGAADPGTPGSVGAAGMAGGTRPDDARFKVKNGEGIELAGTFDYEGDATGRCQLDFLSRSGDGPPMLVHTVQLEKPGPWSTRAPANFGELYIVAFIDKAGDGPSADDPAAMTNGPLQIAESDIKDITLALSDTPDLGAFTPGGGGQPQGSPPPDGPPPDGPPPDGPPPDGPPPDGPPPDDSPAPNADVTVPADATP